MTKINQDITLWENYLSCSEAAFNELHIKYYLRVRALIFRIVNHEELAKDLTQDVFHDLARKKYKGIDSEVNQFSSWLFSIAKNKANGYLRKKSSKNEISTLEPKLNVRTQEDSYKETLQKCLSLLEKREKEIFLLREYEGESYKEVAHKFEITETYARKINSQAGIKIKKCIQS